MSSANRLVSLVPFNLAVNFLTTRNRVIRGTIRMPEASARYILAAFTSSTRGWGPHGTSWRRIFLRSLLRAFWLTRCCSRSLTNSASSTLRFLLFFLVVDLCCFFCFSLNFLSSPITLSSSEMRYLSLRFPGVCTLSGPVPLLGGLSGVLSGLRLEVMGKEGKD